MHGLKKLMLGTAATALAVTALGAPAAAADDTGTLAIVQGIPGVKVDICIGNKEQRSGKAFGSKYEKDVIGTGSKLLRFFRYDPSKTCGGTLIAKKWLNITPGWDQTVVLTKSAPKIVMFDNASPTFLGEIPPRGTDTTYHNAAYRNATDMSLDFAYLYWTPAGTVPVTPTAWSKGDSYAGDSWYVGNYIRLMAYPAGESDPIAQKTFYTTQSRRTELILVGTNASNARFVKINRGVSNPSP